MGPQNITGVYPVRERRATPSEKSCRVMRSVEINGAGERERVVLGAGDVMKNTLRLLQVSTSGKSHHVAVQRHDIGEEFGPGHACTIKECADER